MKQSTEGKYTGSIAQVRAVEDCIRATRRYAEGMQMRPVTHPVPVQGGEFPSVVFTKHYEVFPDYEIGWDMPVGTALNFLLNPLIPRIEVVFKYSYRDNTAYVLLSPRAVARLGETIPGLSTTLDKIRSQEPGKPEQPAHTTTEARIRAMQRAKQIAQ